MLDAWTPARHIFNDLWPLWPAGEEGVSVVRFRIPGKWERRVRLFRRQRGAGWMISNPAPMAMQVEADDACPLGRGPVVWLDEIASSYSSSYLDGTEFDGLEWRYV
jgi:hypothetical protein